MTRMLASVISLAEARLAVEGGADIVDLKNPSAGALGALPLETVAEVVRQMDGRCPTSATVGDLPMRPTVVADAVAAMGETGVDFVKVGLFDGPDRRGSIRALKPLARGGVRVVVVMFADQDPDFDFVPLIAEAGCVGAMLDTSGKAGGGLRRHLDDADIARFVRVARQHGLFTGLAGSLRTDDVAPLLALGPDYLGFRGALCRGANRTASLDPAAMAHLRRLIPRDKSMLLDPAA